MKEQNKNTETTDLKTNSPLFIDNVKRFLLGIIIAPFLYARYSFVLFIPFLFTEIPYNAVLFGWFIYVLFFGFLMGNIGLMKYWTKLFVKLFGVKYEITGQWTSRMMHSHSVWSHPILKIRDKEHKLSIAVMGGNMYEEDDNIRRKSIMFWLFS